ncbi:aminoglycoside phosphotransferase family protein [Phenylobacterium sp.]|uniref:aminoglycoside phosphotransferase family protein n=1 Tax=Phenylobacterium sp. TaxID=1871053 RepID=UPI002C7558B4|nr:aminoglycoside phosphotransferase family protein [Phenylobacterium sp.]HVI32826.1 aminoglycoside phosphotransferase family protein [Phenylobacterium sp.]
MAAGDAIDASLVRRLVAAQFPQWADLPVKPVANGGWDNRTFHLGEALSVRLPAARRYAAAIEKEQLWLPRLAPHLPLPIPEPIALGRPGEGCDWPWSVCRWLPGETAEEAAPTDLVRFAEDLADFLLALQSADAGGGPPAGQHSFHRGGDLAVYDAETREALGKLEGEVDTRRARALWDAALASAWDHPPVWVHGDVAPSNLLVEGGRLSAVIDFGQLCVGDPACDYGIAWTFLDADARAAFGARLAPDPGTWARAKGWTVWKALIVVAGLPGSNFRQLALWRRALGEVLADPEG